MSTLLLVVVLLPQYPVTMSSAGNPHVRFDEGKLVEATVVRLFRHRHTKEAETNNPNLRLQWPASYSTG